MVNPYPKTVVVLSIGLLAAGCVSHQAVVQVAPVRSFSTSLLAKNHARILLVLDPSLAGARGEYSTGVMSCGAFRFPLDAEKDLRKALIGGLTSTFESVDLVDGSQVTAARLAGRSGALVVRLGDFSVRIDQAGGNAWDGIHFRPTAKIQLDYAIYDQSGAKMKASQASAETSVDSKLGFCGRIGDALGDAVSRTLTIVVQKVLDDVGSDPTLSKS